MCATSAGVHPASRAPLRPAKPARSNRSKRTISVRNSSIDCSAAIAQNRGESAAMRRQQLRYPFLFIRGGRPQRIIQPSSVGGNDLVSIHFWEFGICICMPARGRHGRSGRNSGSGWLAGRTDGWPAAGGVEARLTISFRIVRGLHHSSGTYSTRATTHPWCCLVRVSWQFSDSHNGRDGLS